MSVKKKFGIKLSCNFSKRKPSIVVLALEFAYYINSKQNACLPTAAETFKQHVDEWSIAAAVCLYLKL